jgi:hypothetical protein
LKISLFFIAGELTFDKIREVPVTSPTLFDKIREVPVTTIKKLSKFFHHPADKDNKIKNI